MLNVDYLKEATDLEPPDPGQEGEPGERHYGPGQHGPGQPVAEVVEDAEGNIGLGHVGRHCTVGSCQGVLQLSRLSTCLRTRCALSRWTLPQPHSADLQSRG